MMYYRLKREPSIKAVKYDPNLGLKFYYELYHFLFSISPEYKIKPEWLTLNADSIYFAILTPVGLIKNLYPNDWLVYENASLKVIKNEDFHQLYEPYDQGKLYTEYKR